MAGRWHAVPARVLASHRAARRRFVSRVSVYWLIGLSANFCWPPTAERVSEPRKSLATLESFVEKGAARLLETNGEQSPRILHDSKRRLRASFRSESS
jgi:hypothetical protein